MRILIGAPLRQDRRFFADYQDSLDRLIVPDGVTVDRFFIVNDCDEILPDIRGDYIVHNTNDAYEKTQDDHKWNDGNLAKMPLLRNMICQKALDYDYLFSIDTDLVLHPQTLVALLEADKDITSEVFWTQGPSGWWCNAWYRGQYDGVSEEWLKPGLYQVGMTGACTLIKRRVLDKVDYTPIPNVDYWGEDRYFCIRFQFSGVHLKGRTLPKV